MRAAAGHSQLVSSWPHVFVLVSRDRVRSFAARSGRVWRLKATWLPNNGKCLLHALADAKVADSRACFARSLIEQLQARVAVIDSLEKDCNEVIKHRLCTCLPRVAGSTIALLCSCLPDQARSRQARRRAAGQGEDARRPERHHRVVQGTLACPRVSNQSSAALELGESLSVSALHSDRAAGAAGFKSRLRAAGGGSARAGEHSDLLAGACQAHFSRWFASRTLRPQSHLLLIVDTHFVVALDRRPVRAEVAAGGQSRAVNAALPSLTPLLHQALLADTLASSSVARCCGCASDAGC
jgi:hypothetical protein